MTLDQLSPGQTGTITAIAGESDRIERLRELGFQEGLTISLLHQSPFGGDPIAVSLGSMTVALRRSEAALISMEVLSGA